MADEALVVFGVPLYNHAEHVTEAIESLLGQTHPRTAFVLVDDRSNDETSEIAQRYAERDSRVRFFQNPTRLGYLGNARRTFELARSLFPGAEYFAWGSDHDVWHPRWAEAMVAALENHPGAVVAYPYQVRMAADGSDRHWSKWAFSTVGVSSPSTRLRRTIWRMSAGNMAHGLFRFDALARTGPLRDVLVPDKLLFAELSHYGEFVLVPRHLWYRRYRRGSRAGSLLRRQRRNLFPTRRPPYVYLPWALVHAGSLFVNLAIHGGGRPNVSRLRGLGMAASYATHTMLYLGYRRVDLVLGTMGRVNVRIKGWLVQQLRRVGAYVHEAVPFPLPRPILKWLR